MAMTAAHRVVHVGVQRCLRQFASTTSQQPYDVCIVGGGMVGMALAAALGTPLALVLALQVAVWYVATGGSDLAQHFKHNRCVQERTVWPSTCLWWCWTAPP